MEWPALFESSLALIDGVIAGVCRRARLFGPDAEDFGSSVKLALIENDYAVLRQFEGRSSLSTFLVVIVQRLLCDEETRRLGKWHASREAERLGAAAVALERILRRDRRSVAEALPIVQAIDPTLTQARIEEIATRLPVRAPRARAVDLATVEDHVASDDQADGRAVASDADRLSERTALVIRETLQAMPLEDRMIIRFHFGESISIADIAGLLRLPQRPLYRRLEALLRRFRIALTAVGISAADLADLIGSATREMDFGLQNGKTAPPRRTNPDEATRVEEVG